MMVGEAFSLRDQMVCSQKDLSEIYEYISVYNTEESLKEETLEDEGTARMMQASGILGNLDRIRDIEDEFYIDSKKTRIFWEEEMNDEVMEDKQEQMMMTSQN